MRLRTLLLVSCALVLGVACDQALFGFRDLDVESTEEDDGDGGDGADAAHGGDEGGLGGDGLEGGDAGYGGYGGGSFGGYGGLGGGAVCGVEGLGTICTDDLECASCICEDAGDPELEYSVCCTQTCAPCFDCSESTGECDVPVFNAEDPPDCVSPNICGCGSCI